MAPTIQEVRNALNKFRSQLMQKPNVRATGIGYKRVNGTITDRLCIACSVEIKKAESRLTSEELIPRQVHDIPTDVNPTGMFRAFQDPTSRYRPAPGGVSIGHVDVSAGTLGCLVQKNSTIYILSNNHVLANSNEATEGDPILQPGSHDGGTPSGDSIARLSDYVPIIFENGNGSDNSNSGNNACGIAGAVVSAANTLSSLAGSSVRLRQYRLSSPIDARETGNKVDCAIAKPEDRSDVKNEILQLGSISGQKEAALNMQVQKSGRTTRRTEGVIEQVDVTARVNYGSDRVAVFHDQVMAGAMSQGGDSDSAVLDMNNNLVGLLFAGSDTTTLINRAQNVFEALEISLP